ncbi:PDR/VanB family oxidoreductase [Tomitella biformata]|uniref:PDR/VanB family oxidoreductase n=1 Tax=Tomitella biformata TaxID=630403 RepID=UPI0004635A3C|nr:PDR/VanB family oxidoreductase [Tomitella biformata]
MVTRHHVPAATPPDLYGKREQDRAMRVLNRLADGFLAAAPLLYRRRGPADGVVSADLSLTLAARTVEAADQDVVSLVLQAADGAELPAWTPGAHLDVLLPSGRLRQYSLCGDPFERNTYRIAVRRVPDGGGGSIEMHALPVGAHITVRGPRNAFAFTGAGHFGAGESGTGGTSLRFIAGGIGITPILPMVRLADRMGLDWSLIYTGRSAESLPFLGELRALGPRVTVRTDDEGGVPSAAELVGPDPDAAFYCCGPTAMSSALMAAVPPTAEFHSERFSALPVVNGTEFTVELARTGEVLTVPADRTALEVIRERLPDVPYSCQQGFCHTCEVKVLRGEVDHRDRVLTDDQRANGAMLICVSRCGGTLSLDL